MHITPPATYSNRVPKEIIMFTEVIVEVFNQFDGVKWSNKSDLEIGFYYRHKQKKTEYFFGIWYELWEQFAIPLSLALRYTGKAPVEWQEKLMGYISDNFDKGIIVKNYDGWICVLFEYSFFDFSKEDKSYGINDVYEKITEYADEIARG